MRHYRSYGFTYTIDIDKMHKNILVADCLNGHAAHPKCKAVLNPLLMEYNYLGRVSDQHVGFVNTQASVQLDGRVVVQGLPQVPSATIPSSSGSKFHLCACASGRLFLVPANTLRCASANEINNPCS